MSVIVELKDVNAGYEEKIILRGVNLTINDGDFIGIIGPNGGGKTTLLRVILGLLTPYSGKLIYNTSEQNLFGYLPQNSQIDKKFPINVSEVVLSGLMSQKGILKSYNRADKAKANGLLDKYGLSSYKKSAIGDLSGGQLQRVLLCRAIISNPRILVLDEPTTYVDSGFEKELYSLLKELNKEMAIIMVSHDLGTICTHVKTIACVNRSLHYHNSNKITHEQLTAYQCPIELISHGRVAHRVVEIHTS